MKDTINDAVTMSGSEKPMDKSIGDGPTMRPKEERGGRGVFAPGDIIARRYVVEKVLGEGGMGIVYQCLDKVGGVRVAVKSLPPEVSRNTDEMEDIRANYRLVRQLRHPNIAGATTLEKDSATGDYYLVMDLARGMSLKRWMRRNPQATTGAKLAILRQVAAALDYAHAQKVIHRDVKPENVMVDDEGGVKVLDFGLAAQIRSSQSRTSNAVTSRGGTPGYKSPEQWRGKPQREPADVYSFGVMAYWMFAGELPFDGDDPVVLGHAVLTEPVEPVAGLPAHMNAALVKALAKQPNERFTSCGAVVDALDGVVISQRRGTQVGGIGRGSALRPSQGNDNVRIEHVDGTTGMARAPGVIRTSHPMPQMHLPPGGQASPVADGFVVRKTHNVKGIIVLAICFLAVLLVICGVIWFRNAQLKKTMRRRAEIAMQQAEEERRQEEESQKRVAENAQKRERAAKLARQKEEETRRTYEAKQRKIKDERLARDSVLEIRSEAIRHKGKISGISTDDGFGQNMAEVDALFSRANSLNDSKEWRMAAFEFTNYVKKCNELIDLDKCRIKAVKSRQKAQAAFETAEGLGARTYAKEDWEVARSHWQNAASAFSRMEFDEASALFDDASRRFTSSGQVATNNKKIEAERKEAERKRRDEEMRAEARRMQEMIRQLDERRLAAKQKTGEERRRTALQVRNRNLQQQMFDRPENMNFCRHCGCSLRGMSKVPSKCTKCGRDLFK